MPQGLPHPIELAQAVGGPLHADLQRGRPARLPNSKTPTLIKSRFARWWVPSCRSKPSFSLSVQGKGTFFYFGWTEREKDGFDRPSFSLSVQGKGTFFYFGWLTKRSIALARATQKLYKHLWRSNHTATCCEGAFGRKTERSHRGRSAAVLASARVPNHAGQHIAASTRCAARSKAWRRN